MLWTTKIEWTTRRPVPYGNVCPRRRLDAEETRLTLALRKHEQGRPSAVNHHPFDLAEVQAVRQEAVHREEHLPSVHPVALLEETDEHCEERHVGVRQDHVVAALRPLGPVEHAALGVEQVAATGKPATVLLSLTSCGSPPFGVAARASELSVAGGIPGVEIGLLARRKRNVPHPDTGGAHRDTDPTRDLLDREALRTPQESRLVPLHRFHEHTFAYAKDGTREPNPGIPPTGVEPVLRR